MVLGATGFTGHAFPVIALALELRDRGHDVTVHTSERWREVVEGLGLRFLAAEERIAFGGLDDERSAPSLATATRSLLPALAELRPDVVVSDLFTLAPALAAEAGGLRRATVVPHPFPERGRDLPPFPVGALPPRTPLGRYAWRAIGAIEPLLQPRIWRTRRELDRARAELGLAPSGGYHGPISEDLTMVATFPQLEYPRRWLPGTHVTGPMLFELPHPLVELPAGDGPLVLVSASTGQDPSLELIRIALGALADEPVRVLATMNRRGERWSEDSPANAAVVDWVSYAQVMPAASLVVSSGGHGTIARALCEGSPLVVCPDLADMAWNGARVAWSGAGLMVPRRLRRPGALRAAVRRVLTNPSFARRAGGIAAWNRANPGAARGADLVEGYAGR